MDPGYWREDYWEGLREVADKLQSEPRYALLRTYCQLREKGLRKDALEAMRLFITAAESWPVEERRAFVRWLGEARGKHPRTVDSLPQPMFEQVVRPIIHQWQMEMPNDPEPFRLAGDYDSLKRSVELDPTHTATVLRLLDLVWAGVEMACHELPAGILGDSHECLKDVEEIEVLLKLAGSSPKGRGLEEAGKYREVIENYSRYLADTERTGGFEMWARTRGLRCGV